MKRILLISAATVAFASVAAAQDAAVSLMPEVSGSAKAGNTVGASYFEKGKTIGSGTNDTGSSEYFDFDIDIAYTWGNFTATFNVDGGKGLTSNFYNDGTNGIEFQLTYSDGGWDYTVGSNGGDTFVEADGTAGTFGYSDDIPSVFDTTFASKVQNGGFLGSGAFALNGVTSSTFLRADGTNTGSASTAAFNLGGNAVPDPDYAILIASETTPLANLTTTTGAVFPNELQVDYDVFTSTSKGLYFIEPGDSFGVVASTVNSIDSKTGNADAPTLTLGAFLETDLGDLVARVTPTETVLNATADYEFGGFTIDAQVASHSYSNLRSGVNAVSFDRLGSSVGVTFDAGNATHTLTVEEHSGFEVNVGNVSQNFEQGGSRFISYDGDFGDYTIHINQGTREKTVLSPKGSTKNSDFLGGSQAGLVAQYNLTDDVSIGLGYATVTAEVDPVGTTVAARTSQRTFLDAGIKISF